MKVEFVRFQATDGVELQGWLSDCDGELTVLHIHGMSGNGYENKFLDTLRTLYSQLNMSFLTIDTRGRGIISSFQQNNGWKQAGSCYEIFNESEFDIQGAIDYLISIGKKRIILQGHSLGCTKIVNYLMHRDADEVEKVILLAPTDLYGWASSDPNHTSYLTKAKQLIADGRGEELVGFACWPNKTPISAQTYPGLSEKGGPADIYGARDGGCLLGRVGKNMFIVYGTSDVGITEIDGSIEHWLDRVNLIKNTNTTIAIIDGADHGYRGFEVELSEKIKSFVDTNSRRNSE